MPSYTVKLLEIHVTLAQGNFTTSKGEQGNTKIIRLASDVTIDKPGGKEKPKASIKIYNMPLADMEKLTLLAFRPLKTDKNVVAVYAGDANGLSLAFSGDIIGAVPDFANAPDPVFVISAITGYEASIKAISPYTAKGEQDVVPILSRLASQMGFSFSAPGNPVVKIRNPVLQGGPLEQARALADAARMELILDDNSMALVPRGTLRVPDSEQNTPVWKKGSGLLGYPAFDQKGIVAKGIYEPRLKIGGPLRIESVVPRATGLWKVTSLSHRLQSGMPSGGEWISNVRAAWQEE